MFDLPPNVSWLLAWVFVPLLLGAWLLLGWWHCFTSDRGTGILLLLLVACATLFTLFRWGYPMRLLSPGSGQPLPQFLGPGFVGGWVVGFGWAALVVLDRTYRNDANWLREYAQRLREPKRVSRQQRIGALGALQLLVVLLMLFAYLAAHVFQSLIYSFALGTPLGVLLFLFIWRQRET